jgi:hypothetical protein
MHAEYQEVRHVSWLEKLGSSCLGAILGVLLFFGSFVLLVWNEGKLNLATVAQSAVDISSVANAPAAQGKLVSVSDRVTATTPLGDDQFLLPGNYVAIDRTVEMYAWDEQQKTERRKELGGSEKEITTYTYESRWRNSPEDSSTFKYSQNHRNPPKTIPDQLFKVSEARVGSYRLEMDRFERVNNRRSSCEGTGTTLEWGHGGILSLPSNGAVNLNTQNSRIRGGAQRLERYIFQGSGTPQTPNIGDLRICYSGLPVNTPVTVFGQLDQTQISPYVYRQTPIYRLLPGSREEAIATLTQEHTLWTWIFRAGGFLMMWFGLMLVGSPLSAFVDVLPWVGSIAEQLTLVSSFVTAFVLSTVTILAAMLFHHPVALALAISVTLGTLFLIRQFKKPGKSSQAQ